MCYNSCTKIQTAGIEIDATSNFPKQGIKNIR